MSEEEESFNFSSFYNEQISEEIKEYNVVGGKKLFHSPQKESGDNCQLSLARCINSHNFFNNKIPMQGKFNCYYFDNG